MFHHLAFDYGGALQKDVIVKFFSISMPEIMKI
jgi:hypothetical protein